jgi:hypothetical protein
VTATLIDSKTTQDFVALLPSTLTLEDYASTEKVSNLPNRLSTEWKLCRQNRDRPFTPQR